MAGFARMYVEGRGAGRGQRRRDLARDVAGLAHAAADHPARAGEHEPAGGDEVLVDARAQGLDGVALHVDDLTPAVDQRLGREAACIAK